MFSQINVRTKSPIQSIMHMFIRFSIKFKTLSRQKTQKIQEDKTVVFQNNIYKILNYVNPFEQNNDHTRISHEIELRKINILSLNYV